MEKFDKIEKAAMSMHFESQEAKKETKNKLCDRKLEYNEKKKVISQ